MAEQRGITIRITGDTSGLESALKSASSRLNGTFSALATGFVGTQIADKVLDLGKQVLETTGTFQRLGAVLSNQFGSESAGQQAFQKITDFAATTNFSVLELTESFVRLKSQGFDPSTGELRKLGDLANSTGKTFRQLAEAILDAETNEFERLKEFGIKASQSGDKVTFTFKEQETTVQKSASAIRAYLLSLGELNGVQGATAKIAETLEGKLSNLGDAADQLANTVGNKGAASFGTFVSALTASINTIEQLIAGEDELAARQTRRRQNQVQEGLGDAVAKLARDYQNLGLSTEEARKKAEQYFSDSARQNILQTSEALKRLEQERSQLAPRAFPEQGLFLDPLLLANERNDLENLDKRIAALKESRAVSEQYLTTLVTLGQVTETVNKPTKEQLKTIEKTKDILDSLRSEFAVIAAGTALFGEKSEETAKKISALRTAIEALVKNGESTGGGLISGLNDQFKALTLTDLTTGLGNALKEFPDIAAPLAESIDTANESLLKFGATADIIPDKIGKIKPVVLDLKDATESLAEEALIGLAESFGRAIVSGDDFAKVFGSGILSTLGSIASKIGKMAIATGVTMKAIKLSFANPATAIAAGIALVAVGAALSAASSNILSGGGGGGGNSAIASAGSNISSGFSTGSATPNTNTRVVSVGSSTVSGSSISELYISGALRIVEQNGALVGYIEKQKVKLGKTGG